MTRHGPVLAVLFVAGACVEPSGAPAWVESFGYAPSNVHPIAVGEFGFPYVAVQVGSDTVDLPFDLGNMVGLSISSEHFRRLDLPCDEEWQRLDSGGRVVATACVARAVSVRAFGASDDSARVFEIKQQRLPGLIGPGSLPGHRFTLDYGRRRMAVASGPMSDPDVAGFFSLPLVRSPRHPLLILVRGSVRGTLVLIEIDTGKSRTTVDEALIQSLELEGASDAVRVGRVGLGSRSFHVSSARAVSTAGSSEGLPERIALGIGSDILSRFVFTVDYRAGRIWIERDVP